METELKLRFSDQDGQAAFLADPWTSQLVLPDSKATTEMMSRYYDTPDLVLSRIGTTLRIREENEDRVASVKAGSRSSNGLYQRMEWSVRLADDDWSPTQENGLDLTWFQRYAESDGDPDDKLREILQIVEGQTLREICQARFLRTTFDVGYGDTLMELALDEGELCAGDRTERINELELELREGDVRDLMELGEELKIRFGLVPEPKSKFGRCLALLQQNRTDG